ncbi:MAG TPA: SHOCT domain-containing protein [bacterium]|nr:SHOCT domain-containing protein [bacterium]
MRNRRFAALVAVAGVVALVGVLGGGALPGVSTTAALAQQVSQLHAQGAPAPGTPGNPGTPGYGPGTPGYGPRFGPGRMMYSGRRGFARRPRVGAAVFALGALLRFLLLIALLVIAWKVITLRSLWGRPDGALQVLRERFARGEINEEEYRKRLVALS